ncbi:Uncharacterised protein [Mycobacteroides abscessus subsp. massiliense]|nr:Uncharacterised protein [Mycobacteroides abscessus subsp. massiliense]
MPSSSSLLISMLRVRYSNPMAPTGSPAKNASRWLPFSEVMPVEWRIGSCSSVAHRTSAPTDVRPFAAGRSRTVTVVSSVGRAHSPVRVASVMYHGSIPIATL